MTRLLEDDYDSDMTDPRGRHPLPWSFYEEMEYRHKHTYNPAWTVHKIPADVVASCRPADPKQSLIVTLKFRGTRKPGTFVKTFQPIVYSDVQRHLWQTHDREAAQPSHPDKTLQCRRIGGWPGIDSRRWQNNWQFQNSRIEEEAGDYFQNGVMGSPGAE